MIVLVAVIAVGAGWVRADGSSTVGTGVETLSRDQLYALLSEANSAFQQANAAAGDPQRAREFYDSAILLYEKIIDQGRVRNAGLYYNLGNAYFLTDRLGEAILNYRRALRLDASDTNIRNNLNFARSQRRDKVVVEAEKRVLETLFFWHYDFSLRTKVLLACLFFAGLCVTVTLLVWLGRGPALTTTTVITAVFCFGFSVSVAVETSKRSAVAYGVITALEIVARQGDGPSYPPSFKDPLHAGTEFEVLGQRPGWLHIKLLDGSEAWVPDTAAEIV